MEELKNTVSKALAQRALQRRADKGVGESGEPPHPQPSKIIGKTPAMLEVYKTVARVAATKSTVLILGESGTGKSMIARAIHRRSGRLKGPFVEVACAGTARSLAGKRIVRPMSRVRSPTLPRVKKMGKFLRKPTAAPSLTTRSAPPARLICK